jgi:hypothetical protein
MATNNSNRGNTSKDDREWARSETGDEDTEDEQSRVRAEMRKLEKSQTKRKSANRGDNETTGIDTGDESTSSFGPPSDRKSRTKKREHESGTGVTPDPKRSASTFTSS